MYSKEQPATIEAMFDSIAKSYDRTNAILSFGLNSKWNKALISHAMSSPTPNILLDLCSGTGEIAFLAAKQDAKPDKIILLDFSEEMLRCAQIKAARAFASDKDLFSYIKADAESIPLLSNSVDIATVAYGIRNIRHPEQCFADAYRVLKPGGNFAILELTRPRNPFLRAGHTIYLRTLLPLIGWLSSSNQEAYAYLQRSIQTFVDPVEVEGLLIRAGFQQVLPISLSGGIATIIIAKKPH